MGLLDQVLGQVIGNMAGSGQGRAGGAPQSGGGMGDILGQILAGGGQGRPGGAPQGGGMGDILGQILAGGGRGQGQAGGGGIGAILGQVLGGGQGGRGAPEPSAQAPAPGGGLGGLLGGAGGKLSPLVLAILAVLASKHLSSGAGGLGTILHDMVTGGGRKAGGAEQEPEGYEGEDAYGDPPEGSGAPPYPGPQGGGGRAAGGGGGGFLDDVGSMLDGPGGAPRQSGAGGLGDVLGGGFDDLQQRFDRNGQGGLMDSWVGPGANQAPSPGDLEQALGSGTIDQLSRQLGIDKNELLEQLSRALPQVVDGLTPNGRLPTEQEQRGWV